MNAVVDKFRILNVIALVVFSIALGHIVSSLLTGLVSGLSTSQLLDAVKDPIHADRVLVILLSASYSLFSFLIIPVCYLLLVKKRATVGFLTPQAKIRFMPLLLSIILMFAVLPLTAVLIKINHELTFPFWLSDLESYFRKSEENAGRLTAALLSFRDAGDLLISIIVMAILPGIAEELFFRGIVQTQLRDIFKNVDYAIWLAAFLFSFFHFQFYGFIPRLMLGGLLGYIFLWTKNIWYSCVAHVMNNIMSVLAAYFLGTHFFTADIGAGTSLLLLIPSTIVTGLIIWYLGRSGRTQKLAT